MGSDRHRGGEGSVEFAGDVALEAAADLAGGLALGGANPVEASSGRTVRHRLNRGGDRQLNRALHAIATTRMRCDPRTRAYVDRRRHEGKTDREIRRCLKRYIARELFRTLDNT